METGAQDVYKRQEEGNKIVIYHAIKRPFKKSSTPVILKQLIFKLRGVARPKWFALHPGIKSVIVPSISNKYLQNADAVISTWWQTVSYTHLDVYKRQR